MLQYRDNYKNSNYKIYLESMEKIRELKEKTDKLQKLVEDFVNSYHAKENKISNLEREIQEIKEQMNRYLDDLEDIINQK